MSRTPIVDYTKARLVDTELAAVRKLDDVPAAVRGRDMICERAANGGPTCDLGSLRRHTKSGRSVKFDPRSGLERLHVRLPLAVSVTRQWHGPGMCRKDYCKERKPNLYRLKDNVPIAQCIAICYRSDMAETRIIHDPFLNMSVEINTRLVDRLRGRYANGPTLPNGEPEFGWREFPAPPIQKEAADEIERLYETIRQRTKLLDDQYGTPCEQIRHEQEIGRLRAIISACGGYLMNAKIDLETGAPKRTAIRTIEGGIKIVNDALGK